MVHLIKVCFKVLYITSSNSADDDDGDDNNNGSIYANI